MRKLEWFVACAFLFTATVLIGNAAPAKDSASAFNGTWKIDTAQTKFSDKPHVFYTAQGWYHCTSCTPEMTVKADGTDQPVTDQPIDTLNVKIVDDHTIQLTGKKDGKIIGDQTCTVSKDGKQLTMKFVGHPQDGSAPVTAEIVQKRVGIAPLGVHPTSGQWVPVKLSQSSNALTFTYKVNGDGISYSDPTGSSYTANLDGTDSPVKGDYGVDTVSLKSTGPNTIDETDKRKGMVIGVSRMTVHGSTMTIENTSQPSGRTSTYTAHKQK